MIHVTRELEVGASAERLWAILWDVPRMVTCLPGCQEVREVERHRRYAARMTQRVGPITLSVPLDIIISDVTPPRSFALEAKGRDAALGANVAVAVTLEVLAMDGRSRLRIAADGKILGKLGALGQGVMQGKAQSVIDEFADRLRRLVEA